MQQEYWTVYTPDGRKYADCGWERDAIRLVEMVPGRTYRKTKYLQDQVIDVVATTDKQLPGQQGLPLLKLEWVDKNLTFNRNCPSLNWKIHFTV